MRSFRRLPPFLRVVSGLSLLFPLTALVLGGTSLMALMTRLASSTQPPLDTLTFRLLAIALNLGAIGGACTVVVVAYVKRLRHVGRGALPLPSWQRQALTLGLLAALPLCAIVLTVVIPAISPSFALAFVPVLAVSLLADVVVTILWVIIATSVELMIRLPPGRL